MGLCAIINALIYSEVNNQKSLISGDILGIP